jgi:alcohol dehydrogenase class IV
VSGETRGERYDLTAATQPGTESGVAHGAVLIAFAEAVLGSNGEGLDQTRAHLQRELGNAALVDAAAIVATFEQMDRIADATGIPLDAVVQIASQDVQAELGLASFASSHNTPSSALGRLAARLIAPIRTPMMRLASRFLR